VSGTEVTEFANYVGANPLRPDYTRGEQRPLRSKSYFVLEELNFVIKISRIGNNGKEPFWGLGYCQLDILRKRGNCHAVSFGFIRNGMDVLASGDRL
jgi:hypothetical protein